MKIGCRPGLILAGVILTLFAGMLRPRADESPIRIYGATTFAELIEALGKGLLKVKGWSLRRRIDPATAMPNNLLQ